MDLFPVAEDPPSSRSAAAVPASKNAAPRRAGRGWRWAFLCAEAALFSLSAVALMKGPYLHNDDYPILANLVATVFFLDTVFLLFVGPFFFRRLGELAVFAWLNALAVALVVLAWESLPVY